MVLKKLKKLNQGWILQEIRGGGIKGLIYFTVDYPTLVSSTNNKMIKGWCNCSRCFPQSPHYFTVTVNTSSCL